MKKRDCILFLFCIFISRSIHIVLQRLIGEIAIFYSLDTTLTINSPLGVGAVFMLVGMDFGVLDFCTYRPPSFVCATNYEQLTNVYCC